MTALLLALLVSQVPGPQRPVRLQEEGVTKGYVNTLDCQGTGIACTTVGTTGMIAVSAPAMDLTIPVYARADVPTCDSTWLSKEIRVHDTSQEDQTWICQLDSLGAYQWTVYSQSPSPISSGVMADGTLIVTAGATMVLTDGTWSVNATWAGTAVSAVDLDGNSKTHQAMWVAVGASRKFSAIRFARSGLPVEPDSIICDKPSLASMRSAGGGGTQNGAVAAGTSPSSSHLAANWYADTNNPMTIGGACSSITVSSSDVSKTFPITENDGFGNISYRWEASPYTRSGWITLSGINASWDKGWPAGCYANVPTGVTVDDYYWIMFPLVSYTSQCSTNSAIGCGSICGVGYYNYSTGPAYTPFSLVATEVL